MQNTTKAKLPFTSYLTGQLYLVSDNSAPLTPSQTNNSNTTSPISSNTSNTSTVSSTVNCQQHQLVLPRTVSKTQDISTLSSPRLGKTREDKRRVVHNEVERRRRDKINNWIGKLAKILPGCPETAGKAVSTTVSIFSILLEKICVKL